jgi:hypothetical protein
MDFDDLSLATHKNSSSFKKIQYFSKVNPQSLHSLNSDLSNKFDRLNTFFSSDDRLLESSNYKTYRQDMFTVNKSKFNNSTSFIDQKSFNKFIEYNSPHNKQSDDFLNFYNNRFIDRHSTHVTPTIGYDHLGSLNNINGALLQNITSFPVKTSFLSSESDNKRNSNIFKYLLADNVSSKNLNSIDSSFESNTQSDFTTKFNSYYFSNNLINSNIPYRFIDLKSSNQSILSQDRNVRLLNELNPSKMNLNLASSDNNLNAIINTNLNNTLSSSEVNMGSNSNLG